MIYGGTIRPEPCFKENQNDDGPLLKKNFVELSIVFGAAIFLASLLWPQMVFADAEQFDELMRSLKVPEAAAHVEQALIEKPGDLNLIERKSRLLLVLGDQATSKEEQLKFYEQALEQANQVIQLDPKATIGLVRRSAANGKISLFKGVFKAIDLVNQTKKDLEQAISLNNSTVFTFALAHYILGRIHLKLIETPRLLRRTMGIGWGNLTEADRYLGKAVELYPTAIAFRVGYGEALIEQDKKDLADIQLKQALELPMADPGDPVLKKEAKELLNRIL